MLPLVAFYFSSQFVLRYVVNVHSLRCTHTRSSCSLCSCNILNATKPLKISLSCFTTHPNPIPSIIAPCLKISVTSCTYAYTLTPNNVYRKKNRNITWVQLNFFSEVEVWGNFFGALKFIAQLSVSQKFLQKKSPPTECFRCRWIPGWNDWNGSSPGHHRIITDD